MFGGTVVRSRWTSKQGPNVEVPGTEVSCSLQGSRESFYVYTVIFNHMVDANNSFSGWEPEAKNGLFNTVEPPRFRGSIVQARQRQNTSHFPYVTFSSHSPISRVLAFIPHSSARGIPPFTFRYRLEAWD